MKAGRKRSDSCRGAASERSNACCSQEWCPWHSSGSRDSDCDGCAGNRRSRRAPEVQPRGGRGGAGGRSNAVSVRKTRRGSLSRDEPDSNHVDFDDLLPPGSCIIVQVPRVTSGLNVVNDIVVLMTDHFQELMRRGFLDMNKIAASLRATHRWSEWCGRDCLKNYRAMLGHILKLGGSSIDTVDSRPALECPNDMDMTDRLADENGCYLRVQNRKGETRATVMTSKLMSQMFMSGEELFEWARHTGLIYFAGLYHFIEPESIRDFLFAVGVQSFERATPTRVDMIITCRTRSGDRMRCVATLVRQWKPIPDFLLRLWPLARDDKRRRQMPAICAAADQPLLMPAPPGYNSSRKVQEVEPQPPQARPAALPDPHSRSSTVIIRNGEFASPALPPPQQQPWRHESPLLPRPPELPPPPSPRWSPSPSSSSSSKWSPNPPPLPQHLLEHLLVSAVEAKNGLAGNNLDQGGGVSLAAAVEPYSLGATLLARQSGVCVGGGQHAQQQQQDVCCARPPERTRQQQRPSHPVHLHVYRPLSPPQPLHHHQQYPPPPRDLLKEDIHVTAHHHQLPPDLPHDEPLRHHHHHQQREPQEPAQLRQPPIEYDLRDHLTHALFTHSHAPSTAHPFAAPPPPPPSSHHVGQLEPLARPSMSEGSLWPLPVTPTPGATADLQVDWDVMAALLTSPSAPSTPTIVPSDSPPTPVYLPPAMPVLEEAVSHVSSTSSDGSGGHTADDGGGGGPAGPLQQQRVTCPTALNSRMQQQQQQHSAAQAPTAVDDGLDAILTDVPLLNDDTLLKDLSDIAADISLW